MSKETALQIAMRITHRYANSLFDEHTARGRQFMQEMSECLALEREQMAESFCEGSKLIECPNELSALFEFELYYLETYKGGEQ
jgi:hypothetical protein